MTKVFVKRTIIDWRAGASQPGDVNGPIFLYTHVRICVAPHIQ